MILKAEENDVTSINNLGKLLTDDFEKVNKIKDYLNDKNKGIFVYKINGIVLGFIYCNLLIYEIEIVYICVLPNHRKKGIATKLCNYVFLKYKSDAYLEVNINNEEAINFYKKQKFIYVGKRRNYYKNGDDAYIMERK